MAELRCLVCNNVNPENAETCQFCGARLRQPTVPLGPIRVGDAPTKKDTSDLESTLPGWLRDIRNESAAESASDSSEMKPSGDLFADKKTASAPPSVPKSKAPSPSDFLAGLSSAASDDEDEVPDWLASIKTPEPPPATEPGASASQPPAAAPSDWMSGLRAEMDSAQPQSQQPEKVDFGFSASDTWLDETPQKPAPAEETSEDVADWLRTLDQGATKPSTQAPVPPAFPAGDAGVPDWLSGLEHSTPASGAATPPVEQPPAASDWFSATPAPEPAATAPSESTPDWLSSLEAPSTPAQPPAAEPASDLPDWFADLSAPATEPPVAPAPAEATPDWLTTLGEPAAETPASTASTESAPDWLSNLGEPVAPAQPSTSQPASDMPDWLSSLGEPEVPAVSTPAEAAPDWMSRLGEPSTPAQPAAPTPTKSAPDWLSGLGEPEAPAATPSSAESSIPDWMRGSAPITPPAKESEAELSAFEAPSWLSEEPSTSSAADETIFPATEMPAWLSGSESAAQEMTTPSQAQPEAESDLRTKASAFIMDESVDAGEAEALLSMDMPDWLAGMAPTQTSVPTPAAPTESVESTTATEAELPSWVQAMRPVESMVETGAPAEDSYVEDKGPLAGLRDVLPAVPGLFAPQKPRAYANRLELTDAQQLQSSALEALIAAEATPKGITTEKRLGSARVLRWALSVLVLLAVIVPVVLNLLGTQTVPTINSALGLGQTSALFDTVNALQPNDPVLLVFDYDAGLSGELEAASSSVIEHAKLKGARLIAVSTTPSGPLLAERVFARFRGDQFKIGEQYTNLGYVAGGVTGIASFAESPQRTAPFDNLQAWSSKALENVKAYSDFAAVIVITDNADTGRAWIEQTSSRLNGKPLLLISSAQAEPMLWPYYNSQQVKGMVSGLSGGAYYEVLFGPGQMKPGRAYWDAFGYSLTLAELALVIGSIVSLVLHFRARNAEGDEI